MEIVHVATVFQSAGNEAAVKRVERALGENMRRVRADGMPREALVLKAWRYRLKILTMSSASPAASSSRSIA